MSTNLLVSPDVQTRLPDVLIDYLWQLALSGECRANKDQAFTLKPGKLGGRDVQDIAHSDQTDNSQKWHRVFGIEPIRCNLSILNLQGSYQMLLNEKQ